MDMNRLTQKSQEALQEAQSAAGRLGHTEVDGEHLLLALLDQEEGLIPRLLQQAGTEPEELRTAVGEDLSRRPKVTGPGAAPGQVYVTQRLARLLDSRGDAAGAEKLLRESIDKSPGSADLKIALGDYYRFQKRSKEAMAIYQSVADKWAETTAEGQLARNRIVAQHTLDGDIAAAREGIAAILKVAPDNADALLARATFSFLDGKYEDSIADLRTSLRRQKSAEALLLLARSYVGVGDTVVAKAY